MAGTHLTSGTLLLWLIVSVIAANSFIFFADVGSKGVYSELIVTAAVTIAAALGIVLAYRQLKHNRHHAKMYVSLAAGLVLWFCADIIWASYELILHTAAPMPSLSDALWLAGYPFFAYNLFATYREFRSKVGRRALAASIAGNAVLLAYLVFLTASLSDFSTPGGVAMFAVIISYPLMNAVLTVPALPILVGLWKENPWSIPWTFKSLSLFCIVVTDSWFAFIIISGLYEQVWLSSMLFGAEYLILAGGLLWFNKFLPLYKGHGKEHRESKPLFPACNTGMVRHIQALVAAVLLASVIGYGLMTSMATASAEYVLPGSGNATLMVGALLPLTGALSSYGEEADVALRLAVGDVNAHLAASGSAKRVGLVIEDTRTDPQVALEKLESLASEGVRIVIGPATSAEVAAVKQYADQNDILIVSISSTAPDLAIPGDNVLRLVPNDTLQAQVIAQQMWDDGMRAIVPMWRGDVFGDNLQRLVEDNFESLGGAVIKGVEYEPLVGDFSSSLHRINFIVWEQDLRALGNTVTGAKAQYGAGNVGVYIVAFDEIVPILIQADRHPELESVRWYGSDGSAHVAGVADNSDAAQFAIKTNFLNPIYGAERTEEFKELEARIADKVGRTPRSYAEATYDALRLAALTLDGYSGTGSLREAFVQAANSYVGVTGSTELDGAGDRKSDSYGLWAVREAGRGGHASFAWTSVAAHGTGQEA
ncbi:ABC transporter substrate-binding protein [Candidatus Nitrososphaera sp. FF02]|uniref:ABC transporter substrate-binding protein n=1 Tax=Candidatus Nitrososphaera sp. FF02 TaxID=3398226 RepID=UPI0039EB6EFB